MAVTPGNRITVDDLSALADLANSKVSAGRFTQNTVPMYYDGSGNKYGYRTLTSIALVPANLGANYKLGDIVGGPAGSSFSVCAVNSTGKILGLKVISSGAIGYPGGGDPTSPFTLTGGSGAGAKISFALTQIGPALPYSFPDYFLGVGVITAFVLDNPGVGFQVGDQLDVAGFAGLKINATAVGAAGDITTYTVTDPGFANLSMPIPSTVNSIGTTGGHGINAKVSALYVMPQIPHWATELSRIRKNMTAFNPGLQNEVGITGPWPLGTGTVPNNNNAIEVEFYYAQSNPNQSVTISIHSFDPFGEEWLADLIAGNPPHSYTELTFTVVIGGDKNCVLNGDVSLYFDFVPGSPTTPTMALATNMPGLAFTLYAAGGGLARYRSVFTNQSIAPGTYTTKVTVTNGTFHYLSMDGGNVVLSYTETNHTPANGISNTYDVNKIVAPVTPDDAGGWPFGMWFKNYLPLGVLPGFNQTRFVTIFDLPPGYGGSGLQWIYWESLRPTFTASCIGHWLGKTAAVSDLKIPALSNMPWNYARTKGKNIGTVGAPNWVTYLENPMLLGNSNPDNLSASNSYDNTIPVESQMESPSWIAQRWFTTGFVISDAAGIAQFKCTSPGYSGIHEPSWNFTVGATTAEAHDTPPNGGTNQWATWTCVRCLKDAGQWAANTTYNIGKTIIDKNGNTQKIISGWKPKTAFAVNDIITDGNNNAQIVITAGRTGLTVPAWSGVVNGLTNDGTAVWKCFFIGSVSVSGVVQPDWGTKIGDVTIDTNAVWQMVDSSTTRFRRALHRANPVPRYPFYWDAETIASLKPPTTNSQNEKTIWGCGNQWQRSTPPQGAPENGWQQDNAAWGWWIYSVSINRIKQFLPSVVSGAGNTGMGNSGGGMGDGGIGMGGFSNSNPIPVTIGCIRGGVFVAFGTYITGETIQVLWPIFTSDAMVYQCTERVDIQAVAIGVGAAGVGVGLGDVGFPSSATFFNDTEQLLQLINP